MSLSEFAQKKEGGGFGDRLKIYVRFYHFLRQL